MKKWLSPLIIACLLSLSVSLAEEITIEDIPEIELSIETDIVYEIGESEFDAIADDLPEVLVSEEIEAITEAVNVLPADNDVTPEGSGITIDETHFPDAEFRSYVANFDADGDGALSESEIDNVDSMNLQKGYGEAITSLKGIELFHGLKRLNIVDHQLAELDVSHNTALEELRCDHSGLTLLDVSGCPALVLLDCSYNQLTELDVSHCPVLESLNCSGNRLKTLDVRLCTALVELSCSENRLKALDVSLCVALESLGCGGNQLTSLNVSGCKTLKELSCGAGFVYAGNRLTSLDVSHCTLLQGLYCSDNKLKRLDVSQCTRLEALYCGGNRLTSLDVSNCKALKQLDCGADSMIGRLYSHNNQLTSLNISNCGMLETLGCSNNKLTNLDISKCPALYQLYCYENKLMSLDVSQNPILAASIREGEYSDYEGYSKYSYDYFGSGWSEAGITCDANVAITPKPAVVNMAACTVTVKDAVYSGKALKPKVTVRYGSTELKKSRDYTLSFKDNKDIGTATVTVKGKGAHMGSTTATFRIVPKATAIEKLSAGKKKLVIKWKKRAGVTGYQVQYSLKKNFSSKKTATIKKAATVSKTVKGLKSGKRYYVRVRSYKTVDGQNYYSAWSKVKSVKVK